MISHIAVRYMAHHQSHTPRADAGKLVVVVVRNISYNHPRISTVTYMLKTNEKKRQTTDRQTNRLWDCGRRCFTAVARKNGAC